MPENLRVASWDADLANAACIGYDNAGANKGGKQRGHKPFSPPSPSPLSPGANKGVISLFHLHLPRLCRPAHPPQRTLRPQPPGRRSHPVRLAIQPAAIPRAPQRHQLLLAKHIDPPPRPVHDVMHQPARSESGLAPWTRYYSPTPLPPRRPKPPTAHAHPPPPHALRHSSISSPSCPASPPPIATVVALLHRSCPIRAAPPVNQRSLSTRAAPASVCPARRSAAPRQ